MGRHCAGERRAPVTAAPAGSVPSWRLAAIRAAVLAFGAAVQWPMPGSRTWLFASNLKVTRERRLARAAASGSACGAASSEELVHDLGACCDHWP